MKKAIVFAVMIFLALPILASAQTEISIDFRTKYIASPGFIPHDDPVVQVNMFVPLPKGFSFDLWVSTGTDFRPNFGREVDVTLEWADDKTSIGLSMYDLNKIFNTEAADIIVPYIEFRTRYTPDSVSGLTLKPFVRVEYNLCTRNSGDFSALDLSVGAKSSWRISRVLSFSEMIRFRYDDGLFDSKRGVVTRLDFGLVAKVTDQTSVNLSVRNSIPSGAMSDRQNATAFGFGVTSTLP